MSLAEGDAHHLARSAADFIDLLTEDYGDGAELRAFVIIAEIANPNGDADRTVVRWEHDASWAHAAGMAQAAAHGLHGIDDGD